MFVPPDEGRQSSSFLEQATLHYDRQAAIGFWNL